MLSSVNNKLSSVLKPKVEVCVVVVEEVVLGVVVLAVVGKVLALVVVAAVVVMGTGEVLLLLGDAIVTDLGVLEAEAKISFAS